MPAAADQLLSGAGREAFDAMRHAQGSRSERYQPANAAPTIPRAPFGQALQQIAQLVKADVGLEVAFAEIGAVGHHVNEGGADGQIATRLDDFARGHRGARAGPRRSHGGHGGVDDVGVRTRRGGERQSRHRSRSWQRHAGHRRRRARRQVYGQWPGPGSPSSVTRVAISR